MANAKQCAFVAHRVVSALGYHLPKVMENGANIIRQHIADSVAGFTNAEVTQVIDMMDKLEDDAVTKQEALGWLVSRGIIPEKKCPTCHKPITQCKSC